MPVFTATNLPFTTGAVPVVLPDLADSPAVGAGGAAWAYGAWVQISAVGLANHALAYVQVMRNNTGANVDFECQVGTGAAGFEVPLTTVDGTSSLDAATGFNQPSLQLSSPLVVVPANARIAVRIAATLANDNFVVSLGFYPLPL